MPLVLGSCRAVKMPAMPATWHALLPRLDRTVLREALQAMPAVGASAQLAAVRKMAMQTLEAQARLSTACCSDARCQMRSVQCDSWEKMDEGWNPGLRNWTGRRLSR